MTVAEDESQRWWFDDAAGPLVRPYALTGGRTRTEGIELDMVTLVVSVRPEVHIGWVDAESSRLLRICEHPLSVAEAAAGMRLPLRVVKVLLADLIHQKLMYYRTGWRESGMPGLDTMQKVLDGLRAL